MIEARYVPHDAVIEQTTRGKYKCPLCDKTWAVLSKFWEHHLYKPHYRCPDCGQWKIDIGQRHRRAHKMTDPFLRLAACSCIFGRLTKAELLKDAADGDEAYVNASEERDMAEAYIKSLETHLRAHKCGHDFSEIAEYPEVAT